MEELKVRSSKFACLPVRDEAIAKRLGVWSLLESVRGRQSEPLIEVSTTLQRDPNTHSGYDWGGGAGPKITFLSRYHNNSAGFGGGASTHQLCDPHPS